MDILQAGVRDERIPEWLRLQMKQWRIKNVGDLLKTDYAALRFLDIVTDETLKDFVGFVYTYKIYEYVRLQPSFFQVR